VEGTATGKHLVKNRAEGKDVRTLINRSAFQLFGRHVSDCSHHNTRIRIDAPCWNICLRLIAVGLRQLGETKVENLYAAIISNEDVVGFEIAMDDSLVVRCRESVGDLQRVINSVPLAQGSSTNSFAKCFAFQKFRNNVSSSIMGADVVNHEYVWMIECARSTGFLFESA